MKPLPAALSLKSILWTKMYKYSYNLMRKTPLSLILYTLYKEKGLVIQLTGEELASLCKVLACYLQD